MFQRAEGSMLRGLFFGILTLGLVCSALPAIGRSGGDRDARDHRGPVERQTRDTVREDGKTERQAHVHERHQKVEDNSPASGVGGTGQGISRGTSDEAPGSPVETDGSGSIVSSNSGSGGGEVSINSWSEVGNSGSGGGSADNGGGGSGGSEELDDESNGAEDDDEPDDSKPSGSVFRTFVRAEIDREGRERRTAEVLLLGRDRDVATAVQQGYKVLSRHRLVGSEGVVSRLQVRPGESVEAAIAAIQTLSPLTTVSANYLFRPSDAGGAAGPAVGVGRKPLDASAVIKTRMSGHIGIIDTGVDADNVSLRGAVLERRSFGGPYVAREHGTGVAQVAVASGVSVSSVDVFSEDERGLPVASVDAIIRGLDWFMARRVPVVNVSITGPETPALADMVQRAQRGGVLVVAAAGNEGPGAGPAFPAALDGVVAVTAIDQSGRIYRRANRGDYIDFAALGVRVEVVDREGRRRPVSGTSFAAPRVAAILACWLRSSPGRDGQSAVQALAAAARDLGPPGRDRTFGWGAVTN